MNDEQTLRKIGEKCRTDKASHGYLELYDRFFSPFRNENKSIMEIGVRGGQSMRMWKEYFPKGKIFGIDINPECIKHAEENVEIHIGNQTDGYFMSYVGSLADPDVVIDDGSHITLWTQETFDILFPMLSPGGFYVIEDIHCYRETRLRNKVTSAVNTISGIPDSQLVNHPQDMVNFISDLSSMVLEGIISEFHIYPKIFFIRKAG